MYWQSAKKQISTGSLSCLRLSEPEDFDGNRYPFRVDPRCTAQDYFNTRKVSIYAGSNEIQRNIMAKRVVGL